MQNLYQTLDHQAIHRYNKTAIPRSRRTSSIGYDFQNHRPHTVDFQHQNNLFDLTFKSSISNHFKTLDHAQLELNKQFKKQMNPYIKEKIKQFTVKNQRRISISRGGSLIQDPQQTFYSTITTDKFDSAFNKQQIKVRLLLNKQPLKSPIKTEKFIINQALITNTKQRINRLLSLKRQQQEKYLKLKQSLRNKCYIDQKSNNIKPQHSRVKSTLIQAKRLPLMQNQDWDVEWRQQLNKETIRYRNRLIAKHKKVNDIVVNKGEKNQL